MEEIADRDTMKGLLIQKLEAERKILYGSYTVHRKATNEAPSPMQSRYDTSRSELGQVADALAERIGSIEHLIARIRSLGETRNTIQLGSILQVQERNQEKYYIFVVPEGAGGNEFMYEGKRMITIAPMSPIGRALLGKEQGDEIEVNIPAGKRTFKIIMIM